MRKLTKIQWDQLPRRTRHAIGITAITLSGAGTLVGMYTIFSAAGTDPQTVYVGISLALVSTLLGVAVSLLQIRAPLS